MKIKTIIILIIACIANVTCNNTEVDTGVDTGADTVKNLSSLKDIPSIEEYQDLRLTNDRLCRCKTGYVESSRA